MLRENYAKREAASRHTYAVIKVTAAERHAKQGGKRMGAARIKVQDPNMTLGDVMRELTEEYPEVREIINAAGAHLRLVVNIDGEQEAFVDGTKQASKLGVYELDGFGDKETTGKINATIEILPPTPATSPARQPGSPQKRKANEMTEEDAVARMKDLEKALHGMDAFNADDAVRKEQIEEELAKMREVHKPGSPIKKVAQPKDKTE